MSVDLSKVKQGDRVRFIGEGTVTARVAHGLQLGARSDGGWVWIPVDPLTSVEVVPPPVKLYDTIQNPAQFDALPDEAALLSPRDGAQRRKSWFLEYAEYAELSNWAEGWVVVWLPEDGQQ